MSLVRATGTTGPVALGVLGLATAVLVLALFGPPSALSTLLVDLAFVVVSALVLALMLPLARRPGPGWSRVNWGLLSAAMALRLAGDSLWLVRECLLGTDPRAAPASQLYLVAALVALPGVALLLGRGHTWAQRRVLLVDGAAAGLAVLVTSAVLLLRPEGGRGVPGGSGSAGSWLLLPLTGVLLMLALVTAWAATDRRTSRLRMLVGLSATFMVLGQLVWVTGPATRLSTEVSYLLSFLHLVTAALAALLARGNPAGTSSGPRGALGVGTAVRPAGSGRRLSTAPSAGLLPVAALGLVLLTSLVGAPEGRHWPSALVPLAALLLTATLAARHLMVRRELVEQVERYRALAVTDELTGLRNRRRLIEEGEELLTACRASGSSVTVLMIDVDHFKAVNDSLGHAVGDAVLREVALHLCGALRAGDVLGRFGGDEFVALLPATGSREGERLAERLHRAGPASHDPAPGGPTAPARPVRPSLSVGVATSPDGSAGLDSLIAAADEALLAAKREGRARSRVAVDGQRRRSTEVEIAAEPGPAQRWDGTDTRVRTP